MELDPPNAPACASSACYPYIRWSHTQSPLQTLPYLSALNFNFNDGPGFCYRKSDVFMADIDCTLNIKYMCESNCNSKSWKNLRIVVVVISDGFRDNLFPTSSSRTFHGNFYLARRIRRRWRHTHVRPICHFLSQKSRLATINLHKIY